jgi:septal ring factor EnvC (AmiA/AmiB activator)
MLWFISALHVFYADAGRLMSHTAESPVEKVIKLLEDLKSSVEEEAKEEAKTYDEFACFCKDNTDERSTKITDGQSTIDENAATIEKQTQDKEQAERDLKKALDDIQKLNSEIKADEVKRAKEKAEFDAVQADLSKAVDSIENAIKALTPKLVQLSSLGRADFARLRKTIQKSAALADMLGVKPKLRRAVHALLQTSEDREVPENDYEFHSQEILDVLDELKKDFQANLDEKIEEGEAAKKAHDELMETKQGELETADGQKNRCRRSH